MKRVFVVAGVMLLLGLVPEPGWAEGSMAANREGRAGISFNYRRSREADERALDECGRCQIVERFRGSCGAIATGREGGYGYAVRDRLRRAEEEAVEACERHGGRGCSVASRGCDER